MKKTDIPVFRGITKEEFEELEKMNIIREQYFLKGSVILHSGLIVNELGIVITGSVIIENNDMLGNRSILSKVTKGQVFAESYAFGRDPVMVDVVAVEDTKVIFFNTDIFRDNRYEHIPWNIKIMRNLLFISAGKNMKLSGRIFCTSPKTIRGRLAIYFSQQATKAKSREFDIQFNRQQMADYLNLDRSALSKELCRMRDEGIIQFRKNHFILLKYGDEDDIS